MCFAFTISPPENEIGDVQVNERHSRRPVPPYLLLRGRLHSAQHAPLGQRRESVFRHIEYANQRQVQPGAKGL